MPLPAYDEMIEQADVDQCQSLGDLERDLAVGIARFAVTRRVVVPYNPPMGSMKSTNVPDASKTLVFTVLQRLG